MSLSPVERRLVTVRRIADLTLLKRSRYDLAKVDGWTVIVPRIEDFLKGQLVVYCEVDSFLPNSGPFWEYVAGSPTEYNGEVGYLVRTRMIEKHISQGLIFHLSSFPEISKQVDVIKARLGAAEAQKEIMSLSFADLLGVKKWEHPENAGGASANITRPPVFFPQPGCDRVQNLPMVFQDWGYKQFQITEKFDGVPMSVYAIKTSSQWMTAVPDLPNNAQVYGDRRIGVCSRKEDIPEDDDSWFWKTARKNIIGNIHHVCENNVVVQGELCGFSIMGNSMEFLPNEHRFFVFQIFDIDKQKLFSPDATAHTCNRLHWSHVPVIHPGKTLRDAAKNIDDLLRKAEGEGRYAKNREGLVFKTLNNTFSFKVISNSWLLETGKE
ncbi:hypothetical protein F4778DRAFT_796580 [Xylariomycetidae sp. FL2044]|nr:hypothetical protein F4778DRAFT_796580 [Xylariomycetidae sp. FL2044]